MSHGGDITVLDRVLRNTFTVLRQVLVLDFHTPFSGTVVHINTKAKLLGNSECMYCTETAFCTKEGKDKAQVNNCYFLVLQDFILISLCCIREPHTHLQLKQQRRHRAHPQSVHTP